MLTTCGHAFERYNECTKSERGPRSAIEAWFLKDDICPVCQKVLSLKELIPSQTLLRQLNSFVSPNYQFANIVNLSFLATGTPPRTRPINRPMVPSADDFGHT